MRCRATPSPETETLTSLRCTYLKPIRRRQRLDVSGLWDLACSLGTSGPGRISHAYQRELSLWLQAALAPPVVGHVVIDSRSQGTEYAT